MSTLHSMGALKYNWLCVKNIYRLAAKDEQLLDFLPDVTSKAHLSASWAW
jgi:hypothetical protein